METGIPGIGQRVQTAALGDMSFDESIPSVESHSEECDDNSSWISYGDGEYMDDDMECDNSGQHDITSCGEYETTDEGRVDDVECNDKLDDDTDEELNMNDTTGLNVHKCQQCLRRFHSEEAVQMHGRLGYCTPRKDPNLKRRRARKWFSCDQCLRKFRDAEAYSMHVNLCKANILIDMVENWSRITGDNGDVYTCDICSRSYHNLKAYHLHNISALHKRRLKNSDKTGLLSDGIPKSNAKVFQQGYNQIRNIRSINKIRHSYKYKNGKTPRTVKPMRAMFQSKVGDKKPFTYTCDFCYKKYDNIHALKIHQACEKHRTQDRLLPGMHGSVDSSEPDDHLTDTENIKPKSEDNRYECSACLRKYTNERALKIHTIFTCTGNKFDVPELYTCDVCYKSFQSLRALGVHQFRIKHRPEDVKQDRSVDVPLVGKHETDKSQVLSCKDCSKSFSNLHSMKIHQGRAKHTGGYTVHSGSDARNCDSKLGNTIANTNRSFNGQNTDLTDVSHYIKPVISNNDSNIDTGKHKNSHQTLTPHSFPRVESNPSGLEQGTDQDNSSACITKDIMYTRVQNSITCSLCLCEFTSVMSLKAHQSRVHPYEHQGNQAEGRFKDIQSTKTHRCDVCKRQFSCLQALATHQSWTKHRQVDGITAKTLVHKIGKKSRFRNKITSCFVCHRQFKTRVGLLIHQTRMNHKQIKPNLLNDGNRMCKLSEDNVRTSLKIKLPTISCHASDNDFPYWNQKDSSDHTPVKDDPNSGTIIENDNKPQTIIDNCDGKPPKAEIRESVMGKYNCAICGQNFHNWHELRIHQVQLKHEQISKASVSSAASVTVNKPVHNYKCDVCNSGFDERRALDIHRQMSRCHLKYSDDSMSIENATPSTVKPFSQSPGSLDIPNVMECGKNASGAISSCISSEGNVHSETIVNDIVPPGVDLEVSTGRTLNETPKTYTCRPCNQSFQGRRRLGQHKLTCQNSVQRKSLSSEPIIETQLQTCNNNNNTCMGVVSEPARVMPIQAAPMDLTVQQGIDNDFRPTADSGTGCEVWNPEQESDEPRENQITENETPWLFYEYTPQYDNASDNNSITSGPKQNPAKPKRADSLPSDEVNLGKSRVSGRSKSLSVSTPCIVDEPTVIANTIDTSDCIFERSIDVNRQSEGNSPYTCSVCTEGFPNKRAFDFHIFVEHFKADKPDENTSDGANKNAIVKLLTGSNDQRCTTIRYYAAGEHSSGKPILKTSVVKQSSLKSKAGLSKVKRTPIVKPCYSPTIISITDDEDDNDDVAPPMTSPYICTICGAGFASREVFEEHNLIHIKEEAMTVFGLS